MTIRKILAASLFVMAPAVAATSAHAAMIVPAQFAEGVLTNIDTAQNTVTVGDRTYTVNDAISLTDEIAIGSDVNVTFTQQGGKLMAMFVEPAGKTPADRAEQQNPDEDQ